ncbi:MAG: zinc ribbon domain-containing protein [Bryobacteraceae bacterium]|jgi:hypothetical protein
MPDTCTCGAELPSDALFCHKCGKPQRDIVEVEPQPPLGAVPVAQQVQPYPPPASPALAGAPGFRNPVAVRIAVLVGVAAALLGMSLLPFVGWLAGGFFSVFFYRRKTQCLLTVNAGVHMGWITGLVMFPLSAAVVAAQQLPEVLSGRWAAMFQAQMKNFSAQDPALQHQMAQFLQTGAGLAVMLLFSLVFLFLMITGLSVAGGALGAKMVGRR